MITNKQNFYEILQISEDATLQEIERAYMEAKETYSPTSAALYSMFSQEEAKDLHKLIESAYTTLKNQDLRRGHDTKNIQSKTLNPANPDLSLHINQSNHTKAASAQDGFLIKDFNKDTFTEDQIKFLNDCSGSFLQKIRKYKNISLDEISSFSKISKTSILAVEEEDFENLPSRVFVRGFVIQICQLLGINPIAFTKEYLKSLDEFRK